MFNPTLRNKIVEFRVKQVQQVNPKLTQAQATAIVFAGIEKRKRTKRQT
jgi:hypothetical protein